LRTLLLVEDEPHLRQHILTDVPWHKLGIDQVQAAATAEEAISLCCGFTPDLLLTDIRMPGLSGIDLARSLLERFPHLRIIFMSAYSEAEYLRSALRMGSVDYLFKPVQLEDLQNAVSLAISSLQEMQHAQGRAQLAENYGDQLISPILSHLLCGDRPMEQLLGQLATLPTWREQGLYLAVKLHPMADFPNDLYESCVRCLALPGFAWCRLVPLPGGQQVLFLCYEQPLAPTSLEGALRQVNTQLLSRGMVHVQLAHSGLQHHLRSLYGFAPLQPAAPLQQALRPRVSALCEKMMELIHQRYQDHAFGAGSIAQELHYTNAYVCTVFKQKYGVTIHDYINMYRISRAKELLDATQENLAAIAARVGYENDSYFSRVFKKAEGISPSDYRRRRKA